MTIHHPHRRAPAGRRRARISAAVTLAALGPALAAPAGALGRSSAGVDRVERSLIHKINVYRHRHGLRPMKISSRMSVGADKHSRSMAHGRYIGHGRNWASRVRHYSHARHVGEVVAYAYRTSPSRQAHRMLSQWVHSRPHRAVLLTRDFSRAGVGRSRSGSYVFFTVDVAGRK